MHKCIVSQQKRDDSGILLRCKGAQSFHGEQLELPVSLSRMCCKAERSSHLWDVSHLHWDLDQEVSLVLDADILQAWQMQQLAHSYQNLLQV
jgi:hypothetical protein